MKTARWVARLALLVAAMTTGRADAQSSPAATAMSDEVRAHWERGLAEHAAGHYQAARTEFATCYQLAERRECLFAWAQAARLGGDCETAAALYRQYLQFALSPRQQEAAKTQLAVCEAAIAARATRGHADERSPRPRGTLDGDPQSQSQSQPQPQPAQREASAMRREVPPRIPWYRDGWGDALVGAGVVGLAAGAWLYAAARRDAATTAPTYGDYEDRFHGAERTRTWSLVALGAGTAAIAAGVAHMVLRDAAASPAPEPRVGLAVGAAGLTVRYTRRF